MIARVLLARVLLASTVVLFTASRHDTPAPQDALQGHPRGYVCVRRNAPLVVDGRMDDMAWRDAPWTEPFVDIEGSLKPPPSLATRAKMLWDDDYFYVAADLVDPHLWGTLKEHDAVIFHDNDFEVFIDPNGDNHEYYEFEINALGTGWDLLLPRPYKDGGKPVNNWEIPGLRSAIHLDGTLNDPRDADRGWSIELAFPWKVLGELARRPAPPRDGDQWRVNFSRVQWTLDHSTGAYRKVSGVKEHNWVWSPQHVIDMHKPEWWGYVQFSTAPPGRATFSPDPSWPVRRWLQQIYEAQQAHRKRAGRFAGRLDELTLPTPAVSVMAAPQLRVTDFGFEASIELRRAGAASERWYIRQDSLVWRQTP